jgi:ParB-like chromosome segregation protein Spo0J
LERVFDPDKSMPDETMQTKVVPIDSLREAPYNPRVHPEKAIERLAKSIENFGIRKPIVVQKSTNTIIAGHATVTACKKLGYKTIPVAFYDCDDVTAKAYNIADNRTAELTDWDFPGLKDLVVEIDTGAIDIELTGFTRIELKEMFDYGTDDYKDLDSQLNDLEGMEDVSIAIVVPKMYEQKIKDWLANGERMEAAGYGRGVMKRCGLL